MPATESRSVREGKLLAADSNGVKFLRMDGSAALYQVGAGEYKFESTFQSGRDILK
jgi:hypothetical protein